MKWLDIGNRTDIDELNIIYNSQERLWYCCSTNADGTANCSDPTKETFSGPPPNELSTIFPSSPSSMISSTSSDINVSASSTQSISQSTSYSSTSTTNDPVTSPSSSQTVASSGGSGSGLSSNGTIGLTVGLGVPSTLAAIAGAYFGYLAIKKKKRAQHPVTGSARPSRPSRPPRPWVSCSKWTYARRSQRLDGYLRNLDDSRVCILCNSTRLDVR